MTEFIAKFKALIWYIGIIVVVGVICYILGAVTWPRGDTATGTNTNVHMVVVTNNVYLSGIEVQEIGAIVSNVRNPRFVNNQRGDQLDVSFLFDYRLNTGRLVPFSFSEKVGIASLTGWIIGGGWDIMRTAPAVLVGYRWESLALIGTVTVSTNIGAAVYGAWMPP